MQRDGSLAKPSVAKKDPHEHSKHRSEPRRSTGPTNAAAASEFHNLHELVAKARANLNQNDWDYIVGGTETETTLRRNRMALNSIAFRSACCATSVRSIPPSKYSARSCAANRALPVGSLESFHPGGADPMVRGGSQFGISHMLSSVLNPVSKRRPAPNALRMFQLYVRGDARGRQRAIKNGYSAFVFTVDTAHYSRRERDLAKRHTTGGRRRATGREFQMALDWRTVERMKSKYKIPFGIEGIGTAEDAKIALDHGVEIVYVSDHGGRQLDHSSMDVLGIVAAAP